MASRAPIIDADYAVIHDRPSPRLPVQPTQQDPLDDPDAPVAWGVVWFVIPPEVQNLDWHARNAEYRRLSARDARIGRWAYPALLLAVAIVFGVPLIRALLR